MVGTPRAVRPPPRSCLRQENGNEDRTISIHFFSGDDHCFRTALKYTCVSRLPRSSHRNMCGENSKGYDR